MSLQKGKKEWWERLVGEEVLENSSFWVKCGARLISMDALGH